MKTTNRTWLVCAMLATEAVCLLIGISAFRIWMHGELTRQMADQAIEDNRAIAFQFASLVEELEIRELDPQTDDWLRLQNLVQSFELPNEGFVCLTRADTGRLVCHPEILANPELADSAPGTASLGNRHAGSIAEQVEEYREARGRVRLADGVHLVAAKRLGNRNVNVMVHQKMDPIKAKAANRVAPVFWFGILIGTLVLGFTAGGIQPLLKAYDSRLQKNDDSTAQRLIQQSRSSVETRNAIIFGLAKLAESRDFETGEHLERLQAYSIRLAQKLQESKPQIGPEFINDIGLASALHDIGKVGIPDSVLLKPGELTLDEREIVKKHPTIGCECLLSVERILGEDSFLDMAREICLTHHERWDGLGYPLGLAGEKIPLSARIVAVADVYDALTSKRPYKDAMTHEQASEIITLGSGTQFDPDVVAAFQQINQEIRAVRAQCHAEIDTPLEFGWLGVDSKLPAGPVSVTSA